MCKKVIDGTLSGIVMLHTDTLTFDLKIESYLDQKVVFIYPENNLKSNDHQDTLPWSVRREKEGVNPFGDGDLHLSKSEARLLVVELG